MKKLERFGVLTAVGMAITAAGILAPIGWDLYRTRTALEVQLLRSSTIATTTKGVDKLRFVYDAVDVPDLSRMEVAVVNTGRTPIVGSQFIAPIILEVRNGQIVDLGVTRTEPSGVGLGYLLSPDKKRIQLATPLLNPGDAAYITFLTSSANPRLVVSGRIIGVREIALNDRRQPLVTRPARQLTWSIYVVGSVTLIILFFLTGFLYTAGGQTALERTAKAGLIHLPRGQSAGGLSASIDAAFKDFATPEIQPTINLLGQLPPEDILSGEKTLEVEASLREGLSHMIGLWPAFALFATLFVIGCWYVLRSII